ncbi:hypothetical protein CC86DRAFT_87836 [Ophiobolus disseminans]|uniref:Uncharacterized protein n=1 Tax=Ophiobolus disseminans TaxID=1469910 RepID=A0A6A7AG12_9PLEO|nr:hypothetical protein CC86DRAFT_87836 [Ophiobolus disseminans]
MTCRQIQAEAIEELQLNGTWYVEVGEDTDEVDIRRLSSILSPTKARRLYVRLFFAPGSVELASRPGHISNASRIAPDDCEVFVNFVNQLSAYHTMIELTIIISVDCWSDVGALVDDAIDLSDLHIDALAGGNLQKVSLILEKVHLKHTTEDLAALVKSASIGLASLAVPVIGNETSLTVIEGIQKNEGTTITMRRC